MPEGKEEGGLIYRTLREDILVWNILGIRFQNRIL